MVRAIAVLSICGVLAAGLGGCVSRGELTKLDTKIEANKAELAAMKKTLGSTDETVTALDKKVDAMNTALTEMQSSLKAISGDVQSVQQKLAAVEKDLDARVAEAKKLAKNAQGDATIAIKQLPAVRAEITNFSKQFEKMNASIGKSQEMLVKSLENARDIYKTQFLALEEVLEKLKKDEAKKPERPPAEE